jgi:cytochrome oxidase Cu insertion factor (SCO1/SenC/PrrC family)
MRTRMGRLWVACLVLLFTLAFVACGAPAPATTNAPATGTQVAATPEPVLTDLHGPDELKAQFNRDAGMPRLILLVSPT